MKITWVTSSLMGINILEAIEFWKVETWSYPIYTLAYILVMQNIGYNQAKKTVSNITSHKLTEIISSYTVLEVTDDEGEIHLLINIKYTVIV